MPARTRDSRLPSRRRSGRRLVSVGCVLALSLAASCTGAEPAPEGAVAGAGRGGAGPVDDDGSGARENRSAVTSVQPLTGEDLVGGVPPYPVLAVKIDNTASAQPQQGLGSADLVTQELVEGGLTRLVALFYSDVPDLVGPVRSMRASDLGVVAPAEATLVASGAAPPTLRRLVRAQVETTVEGDPGYVRSADRSSPYDLMVRLPELAESLVDPDPDGTVVPPPAYFSFGDNPMTGAEPAVAFEVAFTPGRATSWRFDGGTYERPGSLAAAGDDFAAASVLVLRVRVGDAGYRDPAGNVVPETIFDGRGDALLFHDGRVVTGGWRKDGLDAPLELVDEAGDVLDVPVGRTWIELAPVDGGSVRIGR